ncbi:hypothetical protein N7481_006959 [Penicillium waksmanii]|uniref:uncharacterized protein n=1 Tax=Penicillium waksmanii TaxID=69791 RepID=UPI002549A9D3|nr:uncharacterized protein N7481_006959 [Penicillium waksmanii]KAJ5979661.1 hypothetical protein N7481_006959 [Penicillium waksmanii]
MPPMRSSNLYNRRPRTLLVELFYFDLNRQHISHQKAPALSSSPLPQGENATLADFHSIQTKTTHSPAYFTSGFYKIEAGPARPAHYTFEETKYVLNGQIDVLDEATGITHHLIPGDFAFFNVGTKVKFSTKSSGLAFYAVTRPVRSPHPNLQGREEEKKSSRL